MGVTEVDELTAVARRARTMSFRAAFAALVLVGTGSVAAATVETTAPSEAARESSAEREWPAPGTIGGPPSTRADADATTRLTELGERLAQLRLNGEALGTSAE